VANDLVCGRSLVVRLDDPPECRYEGKRGKRWNVDWRYRSGHEFVWRPVSALGNPEFPVSTFGICVRCWRVAGTNCELA
jgi:hypothetical protein